MRRVLEVRTGDTKARAGIVISDNKYFLACKPTASSKWPRPKLDIPKGHIQAGESPIDAAIRECYEETNIKFEKWKLTRPMKFNLYGEPLFLWLAIIPLPPISKLSCASTFFNPDIGRQVPEQAGYLYIPVDKVMSCGMQKAISPCVAAYFT